MPAGYSSNRTKVSGAKVKSGSDSWREKGKGKSSHKATNVPQAGKRKLGGVKAKVGYAS